MDTAAEFRYYDNIQVDTAGSLQQNFRQIDSYIVFCVQCSRSQREQDIITVDITAEFRNYDNIQENIWTGENSRCGHCSRISSRLIPRAGLVRVRCAQQEATRGPPSRRGRRRRTEPARCRREGRRAVPPHDGKSRARGQCRKKMTAQRPLDGKDDRFIPLSTT